MDAGALAIRPRTRMAHIAVAYVLVIAIAEVVTARVDTVAGVVLHIALLLAILTCCGRMTSRESQMFLLPLMLLPLIRIVSLGLPLQEFSRPWWYLLPTVPLLAAAIVVMRSLSLTRRQVGFRVPALKNWPITFAVICTGLGLGWVEYQILRPAGIVDSLQVGIMLLPIGAILMGTSLMEEFIFRGILQTTAQAVFSPSVSIIYVSALFAILHIEDVTLLNTAFAFAVGLYFGIVTLKTESLWGVVLAHGLLNITTLMILPTLVT